MKGTKMTPMRLRLVLFTAIFLLVAAAVGIFMFGYSRISAYAIDAQTTSAQAAKSNNSLQTLIKIKDELAKNADAVERADQLVAQSTSYVYQDQIINDLNKYAKEAGISITNITFADAKTTPVASTTAGTTPAASSAGTTTTTSQAAVPTSIKSMTATVTLNNPVDYNNMLTFIHLIEQSLFRMQVSQIGLSSSADTGKDTNKVTSDTLTIEVYVR